MLGEPQQPLTDGHHRVEAARSGIKSAGKHGRALSARIYALPPVGPREGRDENLTTPGTATDLAKRQARAKEPSHAELIYRLRLGGHPTTQTERNRGKRLRRAFRGKIIRLHGEGGLRTAGLFWQGGAHPTKADREAIQRFLKAWLHGDGAPQLPTNERMPLDWRLERAARIEARRQSKLRRQAEASTPEAAQ